MKTFKHCASDKSDMEENMSDVKSNIPDDTTVLGNDAVSLSITHDRIHTTTIATLTFPVNCITE